MTRERMYDKIKQKLDEEGLEITEESKLVVDAAICCALEYVLDYAQGLSHELVASELYTEAMVAGSVIRKIKGLMK